MSAGSILMSKTINIVKIKGYDENVIEIKDLSSLGLVDFEFFAHLNQRKEWFDKVLEYSKKSKSMIYACNDGDGIVVKGSEIKLVGKVVAVKSGKIVGE